MTNRRVALRMIKSVAVLTSEPEHFQQHDEWHARAFHLRRLPTHGVAVQVGVSLTK
jgi:hypothetical protein